MDLIEQIREAFQEVRQAHLAEGMEAYMKNRFRFLGVRAPERKEVLRFIFPQVKSLSEDQYWDLLNQLWEEDYREYQHLACDILHKRPTRMWKESDWGNLRYFLASKQWWETIDSLATNPLGAYLKRFPEKREEVIEELLASDSFWMWRCTLIFQLKYKRDTDLHLLEDLIERLKNEQEFFIQKAIGWSLRQVSSWNAKWVLDQVDYHQLQGLAKREAIRKIEF